ncbi:MAG: hypothetical protein Q8P18_02865 [Pseudomonadota bacterium]|nr:hypothetical protein [Pseudomonadota bacterium]
MVISLLVSGALAGSMFVHIGEETLIDVDRASNWGRIFPAETGWDFFYASTGDYAHVPLDEAFQPDLTRITMLTDRHDLVDHGISRCPDGSWLHVSSAMTDVFDDTAWAFRYDSDLALTASSQLYVSEPSQVHRDMPVLCSEGFQGVGFFDPGNLIAFRLVELGAEATALRVVLPEEAPIATGAAMFSDGATVGIASFAGNDGDLLHINEYAFSDLALVDSHLQNISVSGQKAYWSQGYARVGDHHVIAHMARDESAGFEAQDGDVWLSVFNLDWRMTEQVQVSHNTPPFGGMQPWLTFRDDTLVVTYTREIKSYIFAVTIDRVEAGLDPRPDEPDDTGEPPDTDDTSADTDEGDTDGVDPDPDEPACGCNGAGAWLLVPLLMVGRRRC